MSEVLIVDDSETVLNEVSSFLNSEGIDTALAHDGCEGLRKIKDDHNLKLVICDVNMPNMDGLTMVEKLRSELGNNSLPVIMLTTENNPEMKERGKSAGVKGWIVKPFNGAACIGAIKKLIT